MAKRNTDSGRGRRGSSRTQQGTGRSSDRPKKFDSNKSSKPPRRERTSPGAERGGDERPFKKFDKPSSAKRPFKKFDKPSPSSRPFKKREDDFEGKPRNVKSASGKPFKKTAKFEERDPKERKKSASYGLPYKRAYDKGSLRKGPPKEQTGESELSAGSEKRYKPKSPRSRGKHNRSAEVPNKDSDILRLNRYIANSGLCSRREADEFIKMGLVTVNGNVITELGHKVKRSDEVRYEGRVLKAEKPVYILMNKPKGYITTTKDPQERNTVMHLIGGAVKERVYPVGRLDRNTTGLLLLTNDGELADRLMHPSYQVKKIYKVELDRPLTKADFEKIKEGVYLDEGRAVVDDIAILDNANTIGLEIHIGWNRVVRRIFEALGYQVVKLDRSVYAGLDKKDLGRGEWRFLKSEEVVRLKHYKS